MLSVSRLERGGAELVMEKPEVVLNYIKSMGEVDLANQYASTYCFFAKGSQKAKKVFFWERWNSLMTVSFYQCYKTNVQKNNKKIFKLLKICEN